MLFRSLRGLTVHAAAAAAGVSNSHEFMHPAIAAVVQEYATQEAPKVSMTRERLTEMLLDTCRNAATAGEQVAAVRELGKLHGLYAPQKLQVDTHHTIEAVKRVEDMRTLSVEQLERLVKQRGGQIIEGEAIQPRLLAHGH